MPGVEVAGSVAVVTGGANGIGRALAERFAAEGARAVVVADLDGEAAIRVAESLGGPAHRGLALDVTDESAVRAAAERIMDEFGGIDIYCSNAGIGNAPGLGTDAQWDQAYRLHVLAHVYAARHVLPGMLARGRGHLLVTASAAGLLTELDTAAYTATKHASVALAEWLAIRHGDSPVSFSCLCPQGVRTAMTADFTAANATVAAGAFLEPEQVADAVLAAFAAGTFLILPHPEVADFERRRAGDRDRWLAGMRKVRARLGATDPTNGRES